MLLTSDLTCSVGMKSFVGDICASIPSVTTSLYEVSPVKNQYSIIWPNMAPASHQ